MARQTKKPSKWKKSYKHHQPIKKKLSADVLKRRKNINSIKRAKEMEEDHRKQKTVEDKYRSQAQPQSVLEANLQDETDGSANEEEKDVYETLMAELAKDNLAVTDDSASGEEEEEEDEEDEQESMEEDDVEEQSVEEVTVNEDDETEIDTAVKAETATSCDPFASHLDYELPAEEVEKLLAPNASMKKSALHWAAMGQFSLEIPQIERPAEQLQRLQRLYTAKGPAALSSADAVQALGIKSTLAANITAPLTALQSEILNVLNNYQDYFYSQRTFDQTEELRTVYCVHALNHMLKTRARIVHHSAKLNASAQECRKEKKPRTAAPALIPDSYRDQGLVRPKVLIVLPFRESAYRVVSLFRQLLHGDKLHDSAAAADKTTANLVMNYERFVQEYTGQTLHLAKTNPKPEDYERIFTGNTDDNFRIGMSLTKKCLKLYTDFYASDILIASPLGLRMIVGAPGSKERDYDFLNSIELLIIDQAELIYAQNWENLVHVLEHLHLQPQSMRDTDFLRVRPWCLSGLSRFYRQTVLLASHELPEFRALFNNTCCNYAGKVRLCNPIERGDIRNVAVAIPQLYHRIEVSDLTASFDQRFQYFIREVLPRFRSPTFAHCMLYVPSYFDYVRLRNYFKAETISFVQICEYTHKSKMARARDIFYHSGAHFLLYSERSHFYRRTRVKGIRHLIMYQPPLWPHFYAEMINQMHAANQNVRDGLEGAMSVTVLYTKYDLLQLNAVLGSETAAQLLKSGKRLHTFAAAV